MLDGTRTETPIYRAPTPEAVLAIPGPEKPVKVRIITLNRAHEDLKKLVGHFVDQVLKGEESRLILSPSNTLSGEPGEVIDFTTRKRIT